MIVFDKVHFTYPQGGSAALRGIKLTIPQESFTFITGHTGAGKTTLIRLIMAMIRPNSGALRVGDQIINSISLHNIPRYRRNIGLVFQDHQLLFDRDVFHNVALPLEIIGYDYAIIQSRVEASLRSVKLLHKRHAKPQNLSVGEQQRLCVARAVVAKPKILIADEPTGNLDQELSLQVMELLYQFNVVGTTVLVATHDHELIDHYPQARVIELKQGELYKS